MVAVIYFANIKPILASASIIQALKSQKTVLKKLKFDGKVFSYNTFGSGEAREQLLQMAFRAQAINISPELKQKFLPPPIAKCLFKLTRTLKTPDTNFSLEHFSINLDFMTRLWLI